jgi:hypothetical protein
LAIVWPALLFLAEAWLAPPAGAEAICVRAWAEESQRGGALPARIGEEVRLRFRHSLYRSHVEEQFRITEDGLRLVRLRYAERRLAEFYGHEAARREGRWWVVEASGPPVPSLTLRSSAGAGIVLSVGGRTLPLWQWAKPGEGVHLMIAQCEGSQDGR